MEVKRRADLDEFEASGVPAWLLVGEGWRFECDGCGMHINDCTLPDEGLPITGVVGREGREIYCSHVCRMESKANWAARKAYGEAFVEMLKDIVRSRFPDIEHHFGEYRQHVYVPRWVAPITVIQAKVSFSFPGMKYGPASLEYHHCGKYGAEIIGPVQLDLRCCSGDREAFEAVAEATP